MADNNLANELKRLRFAPGRGTHQPASYPFDIHCRESDYHSPTARVMGFKQGAQEIVGALRESMRESDFDSDCITRHPTFVMLQRSLPPMPHTETKSDRLIFTHYDRIGWWGLSGERFGARNRLDGMAHVRHVAIIERDTHYHFGDSWDGFALYQLQLLDLWDGLDGKGHLEQAIVARAIDHIEQIGSAAINIMDNNHDGDYDYYRPPIPVIAEIQHPFLATDLAEASARIAATLSPLTDERSQDWSSLDDQGTTLSAVLIKPMSQDDEDEIEKITTDGIASVKPEPLPKAEAGSKHLLVEVTDKHLVLLRKGQNSTQTIGHTDYGHKGRAVRWRLIVDEGTRVFYVEPLLSKDDETDIIGFLQRAWSQKPNLIFEGPPHVMQVPKSYLKKLPSLSSFLSSEQIEMVHPSRGLGLGVAIGRTWLEDSRGATSGTGLIDLPFLRQWTIDHQLVITAAGWYSGPDDKHRHSHEFYKLGWLPIDHYTGIRVDTRAFVSAIGRENVELLFQENWPTRGRESG